MFFVCLTLPFPDLAVHVRRGTLCVSSFFQLSVMIHDFPSQQQFGGSGDGSGSCRTQLVTTLPIALGVTQAMVLLVGSLGVLYPRARLDYVLRLFGGGFHFPTLLVLPWN